MGLVQRKRQVASSVWGYLNDESDLDNNIDAYAECKDAKVEELIKIIKTVFDNGPKKLVVFALFRKTLKYLAIRLKKYGYQVIVIHGQVDNRAEKLEQFKNNDSVQILLSSEVGSEGLDMQFCNSMVNYDLPWNPMVVEQRIGRIDRFGQKAKVVNIYNLVVDGSIQEEIYMRLLDRIGIFRSTIGDMEAILDAPLGGYGKSTTIQDVYNKMEKDFFTKDLTEEEKNEKIAEVERAIENEKENLHHLQEGLSNTLTNDAYFQDEIHRILDKNAYVTDEELKNFLQSAIRQHLTTCNIEEVSNGIMEFSLPMSDPSALQKFLNQYIAHNDEANISMNQFKQRIDGDNRFKITFKQEIAYDNASVNYLNIYHPMIQACLNYFIQNDDQKTTSFSYALKADNVLKHDDRYYLAMYQLSISRLVHGIKKTNAELQPVVFNLQTRKIEENSEVVDSLYRKSQVDGYERNPKNSDMNAEIIDDMRYDFADYITAEKKRRQDEANKQLISDRQQNELQTKEYYQSRIDSLQRTIRDNEAMLEFNIDEKEQRNRHNTIRLMQSNIAKLEKERDEKLSIINEDNQLQIDEKLLSLNLITII